MIPVIHKIFAVCIVLGVAIFVHEWGHFLLAKRKGVRVERFSLGFGPRLFGFRRGDTEYVLSLIPFGGYLKMAGEKPGEGEGAADEFFSKSPVDRIKIVVAGPLMNVLMGCILITAMFAIGIRLVDYSNRIGSANEISGLERADRIVEIGGEEVSDWRTLTASIEKLAGQERCSITILRDGKRINLGDVDVQRLAGVSPLIPAEVGEVKIGLPAHSAGIKVGDKIISVDGKSVADWSELADIINASPDREIELVIDRKGKVFPLKITPMFLDIVGNGYGVIGISPPAENFYVERFGWKSPILGLNASIQLVGAAYKTLWLVITQPKKTKKLLGGPGMIAQMAGEEAKKGLGSFLWFMGFINIMLATINLVPFPALDGGHCALFLIEKLRRRPFSLRTQELIQQVGMGVLILLMAFLVMNDAMRQIERAKAIHQKEMQLQ